MKIVFMGTPDFAAGALQALLDAEHEVVAVYTQPDKPKGRGKEVQMTPVKQLALLYNIPVHQPARIRVSEEVEILKGIEADVYIVAAFGQILTKEILDLPKHGCLNIHASLLPKYRGAAPIQWAIIDGEEKTGVTIMQMNEGIDTGDMLYVKEYTIAKKETGESLFDTLMNLGAEAIVEALKLLEQGTLTPVPQKDEDSTHAKRLDKKMGRIDFANSAVTIERLVRGLNAWPTAYTSFRGKKLTIWDSEVAEHVDAMVGSVTTVDKTSFCVATSVGALKILEVQLEGKKRMAVKDFLLGYQIAVGERLGE